MKEKFTILIQGPLNEDSLQNISNYLKFGKEVIVSHWDSDDLSLIQKYQQDNVYFIGQEFPGENIPYGCNPNSTFYWAIRSTGLGVSICKTEFIIKTRSDEYFSDLQPIIKKLLENEHKLVCSNILFRNWATFPFYISDHLFAAQTNFLKRAYEILTTVYHQDLGIVNPIFFQRGSWSAEQILAAAFLYQFGIILDSNITQSARIKILERYFDIVDVNNLNHYKVSWQHRQTFWENNYRNEENIQNIQDVVSLTNNYFQKDKEREQVKKNQIQKLSPVKNKSDASIPPKKSSAFTPQRYKKHLAERNSKRLTPKNFDLKEN